MSEPTAQQQESVRLLVLERTTELLTAALSLVAALAWNDAIQSLFKQIFGEAGSLYVKFAYAIFITALIVFISMRLTKLTQAIRNKALTPRK